MHLFIYLFDILKAVLEGTAVLSSVDWYQWLSILVILTITFLAYKISQFQNKFKKYGIPQPDEVPFLGHWGANIFKQEQVKVVLEKLYNLNKEAKYVGFHNYSTPVIMLCDLDLIKSVMVRNFDHFASRKKFVEESSDPLFGKNLSFLNGAEWKEVRNLLSPSFTSSKMRGMFDIVTKCAENFTDKFFNLHGDKEAIDMKDAFARYTNDVIATCAFGIEVDSIEHPENDFYTHAKLASLNNAPTLIKLMLIDIFPNLTRMLGMRIISKKVTDFFVKVVETAITTRIKEGVTRSDMLQLILEARGKNQTLSRDLLDITAQAFIFILGGFDTTSDNMCMLAYELAVNPEVQKKLQDEIDEMMRQCDNKPTYESINNLPYLDSVFVEVLRMHPMPVLNRVCSKEFELPPALPNAKPYLVKPGVEIFIPVSSIHDDNDYFDNPRKFDPERHSGNKKAAVSDVTSLGFGLGPRMCIGNRFAIFETKVLFVYLLKKCSITPSEKTCIPLEYSETSFAPAVKGGCWLQLKMRS